MKIKRILNNNVVISENANGDEIILAGKGLGFQKKADDSINEENIHKIFYGENNMVDRKTVMLLNKIDIEVIEISKVIVDEISLSGINVSDAIFISISDHINGAISNYREGIQTPNSLLYDIRNFYQLEYKLGLKAIELINARFNISLEKDEAGFIAMHIVNSQTDKNKNDVYSITKLIHDIVNIVTINYKTNLDTDSIYYYRFITHLKFFCKRVLNSEECNTSVETNLLDVAVERFTISYKCALKIASFLYKSYNYEVTNDEIFYLTIHIERLIENN